MIASARRTRKLWIRFWLQFAGFGYGGRLAYRCSAAGLPPFYGRIFLAEMNRKGFISGKAVIHHSLVEMGCNVFMGDGILIYQDRDGGRVKLEDRVKLIGDTTIQTGFGGSCIIGTRTCIQPNCQFSAYKSPIRIGSNVEIAPYCAFYPYDHGTALGKPIHTQPLQSRGGIDIGDEVWLSVGVTVLDGVRIGKGAVVGAGSVVTKDLPDNSVSAGVPARVIRMRD